MEDWIYSELDAFTNRINQKKYDVAFIGEKTNLDDRSIWAKEYLHLQSEKVNKVTFDIDASELKVGDNSYNIRSYENINIFSGQVLIDATTLSIPELIYLFLIAKIKKQSFDLLYLEPSEYSASNEVDGDFVTKNFSLSEDGKGIIPLPLFNYPINNRKIAVALGFEGHRFGALLQSDEYNESSIASLFGVPPFYLGWERYSFDKNEKHLNEILKYRADSIKVAGANDPYLNYQVLKKIYKSEAARIQVEAINLAAFGTKPVAVALAWFAVNNDNVGVLYDFPNKKEKRSEGHGKVHLWSFTA